MKRILCILSSLNAGGAETFLMKIYRALPANEYRLDFVVSHGGGCYTQEVFDRGGRIYEIPKRTEDFLGAFRGIRSIVKENNYDTVLKLGENSLAVADLIAAKLGGATNLALRSCNAPTGLSIKMRCIHNLLRPLLNSIATVKLAPSRLAADFMFGKRCGVTLINNGVDLEIFHFDAQGRERVRSELGLDNKFVVGHIGRFNKQKNHRYLLEVFCEISKIRSDAVLVLVGVGEDHDLIVGWISELGLEDRVVLTGQRFDIPQVLSAMDVFIFPSLHEGMPNTVIEAQATGLPCVIADTITREADITGLIQYLPLSMPPCEWATVAMKSSKLTRRDTSEDFIRHGYDIGSVAKEFLSILKMTSNVSN